MASGPSDLVLDSTAEPTSFQDDSNNIPLTDPLDLPAAILYVVFDLILTLGPVLTFYLY